MVIIAELETRKMFSTVFITLRVTAKPIKMVVVISYQKHFKIVKPFHLRHKPAIFPFKVRDPKLEKNSCKTD